MPEKHGFIDFRAVKAAVTMEQILEHYGLSESLRPLGTDSLTGCCPIHKGTNPTQFRISRSKNCWNCFSTCHCGGNVLDFICRMEEVPIHKAAQLASEWFQVQFPSPSPNEALPVVPEPPRSSSTTNQAAPIAPPPPHEVQTETAEPNQPLGFTLNHLDPLHPYFAERGLRPENVAEFGLGHCKKGLLAGRVAIPIHNGDGQLVAYAGRWPGEPPAEKAKYQFPKGFRKSLEVFNLHRAKQADGETPLIIVEGFFDCMKVWQAGLPRVVALMGSSLSASQEEQIVQCVGSKGQIALLLDDDEAGHSARAEALRRFASRVYVRIIELRNYGRQPDELSEEALHELLLRDESSGYQTDPVEFPAGRLVATPNALRTLSEPDIRIALARHLRGDWGILDEHDRTENERALLYGDRVFSVYQSANGTKFWIITEADRSATTVMLPADY